MIACRHARPGLSFRPFTRRHLPTRKTWRHPFCHCGVRARQASTVDPQSSAETRTQPSGVGSDHHRVMRAPDASSTCHPFCDCASAINCFSSAPCSRQKKVSPTVFAKAKMQIDVGFASSGSRASFASLTSGLELQPWQASRISPFVRGEIGFLGESDYAGWIAGAGGGVVLRLRPRLGLRAGGALNAHGGVRGPVTSYGGMEYRW